MLYHYYLGPWDWRVGVRGSWEPPRGTVATIDLASMPQLGTQRSDHRPIGFFAVNGLISAETHAHIGHGDCRDLAANKAVLDAWQSLTGYRPQGDRLVDLLWDHLTAGSDPSGEERCKPLMPTTRGRLELHLPGHSMVKAERFEFGKHPHTEKVKGSLQRAFRKHFEQSQRGNGKAKDQHRRVLDYWCEQYGAEWQEFVPDSLRKDVPGRLKHETVVTDSFDRADSTTIGNDSAGNAWTETAQDWVISGNSLVLSDSFGDDGDIRNGTALSSSNHYAQAVCAFDNTTSDDTGVLTRFSPSARSYLRGQGHAVADDMRVFLVSGGGFTTLGSKAASIGSETLTVRLASDGSTHTLTIGGNTLAVTYSGFDENLYTGCGGWSDRAAPYNSFEAGDLTPVAPTRFIQLERTSRGMFRGVYMGGV